MLPNTIHYVTYNGIQLNLSRIEAFESETVYDPDEVDRTYNHLRIRCSGIANPAVNLGSFNNAAFASYLRVALMEPRRPLTIAFNGVPTVNITEPDANNGPNPLFVRVYQFEGNTIYVDFEIEAWEAACPASDVVVTSNRWTQATDIDADGYTTLTSTGRITLNSNRTTDNADAYRGIPFPVHFQPQGFQRVSQHFSISSDGTELDWTCVDREVLLVPPAYKDADGNLRNITRWEGQWEEGSSLENWGGTVIQGNLSVKAWGQKDTPKNLLLQFCLKVLAARRGTPSYIKSYSITEGLSENSVAVNAEVITFTLKTYAIFGIQGTSVFANTLDIYESGSGYAKIGDRGNAGLWLIVKDIVATCDSKTTLAVKAVDSPSNQTPTYAGNVPTKGTKTLDTQRNYVKQDSNPYLTTQIETQVVTNNGQIQLARASGDVGTESFIPTLNSRITKKIVRFKTSRLNAKPQMPKPEIEGCTLLSAKITMADPTILSSGVDRIYGVEGQYIFAVSNPINIGVDTIVMPHQIADNLPLSDSTQNYIAQSDFITGQIA